MTQRSGLQVMGRLVGLVKPLAGHMLLAILMGVIGHFMAASITILGALAVLNVLGTDTYLSLPAIFGCALFFALLRAVLHYLEQNRNHYIAFKLLALVRDRVFAALRRLCPAKLEGRDKGNLISVITSDIELLEVFYAHTISPLFIAVIFSAGMTLAVGWMDWRLGLVALCAYLVVGGLMPAVSSRLTAGYGTEIRERTGELSSFVLDNLRGLGEIQQYGAGQGRIDGMGSMTDALNDANGEMGRRSSIGGSLTTASILVFDLVMLVSAVSLFRQGDIGFGRAVVATVAMMSSFGPVAALAALGSTLQSTFAAGNRVLDILDDVPQTEDVVDKGRTEFDGAKVDDVSFSYGDFPAVSHVSLDVPNGSIIGISGKSGSGKSTLLKLMMRFWSVRSGEISISGKSVECINTSDLRGMEGYVTQDTHLFHDSIRNNLLIAKLDATDEEIRDACRLASVHDFVLSLPDGYDTEVGELGDTLSGGERQRLGLARAFLHGAPLLLLDEPTSNLDSLNESIILRSLDEGREGRTVVIVSHRASTLRTADEVYEMDTGRMC